MDDEVHRAPGSRSEDTSPDPEMAESALVRICAVRSVMVLAAATGTELLLVWGHPELDYETRAKIC